MTVPCATHSWTQEAEDAQPDAPCRRTYSRLVIETVYNEVPVRPDGYSDLIEIVLPQVRIRSPLAH